MKTPATCRLIALLAASAAGAAGAAEPEAKTVIGPRNVDLYDGAQAMLRGDYEEGVRLTLLGLRVAQGPRERQAALSNLCAGYAVLDQLDIALEYCNQALAENQRNWRAYSNRALTYLKLGEYDAARADIERGQEIAPNARSLKEVKGMLLDEVEPVSPRIVIDDRRDPGGGDDD